MFYLRALKNVLRYIWRFITSPFRFWLWCLDLERSNIIAVPVLIGSAVAVVWGIVSIIIWFNSWWGINATPPPPPPSAEEIRQQAWQAVTSECESKGGTYAFVFRKGDEESSWACISATRIELEHKHPQRTR